ncbi:MAG: hypothetical protein R3C03_12965 [Pirellulaceae bacterium]
MMNNFLRQMLRSPRHLLVLDFFGALVTSGITASLLATEIVPTGLPVTLLIVMAMIAAGYAVYDLVNLVRRSNIRRALFNDRCVECHLCIDWGDVAFGSVCMV